MLQVFVVPLLLGISCAVPSPQPPANSLTVIGPAGGSVTIGQPIRPFNPILNRPVISAISSVRQNNPVTGPVNPVPVPTNPVAGQGNPVAGQGNPVAGQGNPVAGHSNPVAGQSNPVAGQANPVVSQNNNPSTNEVDSNNKQILGRLITEFGLEMSEMIHQNGEQDTVVFSPLSIATLLSVLMAGMGKQSQTYVETANLLGYKSDGSNEELVHQLYRSLINDLSIQSNQISFSMGNQLFLQGDDNNRVNILGSFTKTAKDNYNAGIETLNFFSDPFGAATRINEWVSTATNGKIPQLLTDPLSPQTKFMAVNTVYFKAPWLSPFSAGANIVKSFDTGRGKIDIPFMIQIMGVKGHEQISERFNATIVELPYKGERYSMFIMKPKGPPGIDSVLQLEYALTNENLNFLIETTKSKSKTPVSVQIPRMRLRYRAYLKEILENLGATSMFNIANADFSRITSNKQPILDNMIHEAVMDITEEGTEAAAATSTTSNRFGTNLIFELNQPSLLFIYDSETKVPIFWARLVTPESI